MINVQIVLGKHLSLSEFLLPQLSPAEFPRPVTANSKIFVNSHETAAVFWVLSGACQMHPCALFLELSTEALGR